MKIARVSENGRTWIWRYDWLKLAMDKENKRCIKYKTSNVFAELTVVHIYEDGLDT